jgi:hypothetical protein
MWRKGNYADFVMTDEKGAVVALSVRARLLMRLGTVTS